MPRKRQQDGPIIPGSNGSMKRPAPPVELEPREKRIWRDIVASLPADWFTTSQPVLTELCRHIRYSNELAVDVAQARTAIDQIKMMPEPPLKLLLAAMRDYRILLRSHGYQSERVANLSTKLRLSPQSRYQASTAQVRATEEPAGPEPWNDWAGADDDPPVQ
jgi:hypothetical protein